MKFLQLKNHVSTLLKAKREVAIPSEDADIIPLVSEAMLHIANRYKVLKLVTKSANFKILRSLGNGYYIRSPKIPKIDTDAIDIDTELQYAVANYVAAALASETKNIMIFTQAANRIVKDYSFKIYKTPTNGENQ